MCMLVGQINPKIGSENSRVLNVKVMIGLYLLNLQLKVTIHKAILVQKV